MKYLNLFLLLVSLAFSGCAQTVSTHGMKDINSIPMTKHTLYLYSSGEGERFRVVLMKSPESDIEIVPYSVQITTVSGTLEDAVFFMKKSRIYKDISFERVTYKSKLIGYLLTFGRSTFAQESIEVDLYERAGKVYFAVQEKKSDY